MKIMSYIFVIIIRVIKNYDKTTLYFLIQDTQRNATHVTPEAPVHPCLLQHYSQYPIYRNSKDAPLLMNGSRKFGIYTQWNSTQP
jgi:hypothetical protein